MMELAIAVLVGFVAAGFVWYGWGLLENVLALLGLGGKKVAETPPADLDDLGL
jgi:hypothetical protein